MATKKRLPAAGELVKPTSATQADGKIVTQMLESCRLKFKDPTTFAVTSVYITRTDARRFRVKIFCGGKCVTANYIEANSFIDVMNEIKV